MCPTQVTIAANLETPLEAKGRHQKYDKELEKENAALKARIKHLEAEYAKVAKEQPTKWRPVITGPVKPQVNLAEFPEDKNIKAETLKLKLVLERQLTQEQLGSEVLPILANLGAFAKDRNEKVDKLRAIQSKLPRPEDAKSVKPQEIAEDKVDYIEEDDEEIVRNCDAKEALYAAQQRALVSGAISAQNLPVALQINVERQALQKKIQGEHDSLVAIKQTINALKTTFTTSATATTAQLNETIKNANATAQRFQSEYVAYLAQLDALHDESTEEYQEYCRTIEANHVKIVELWEAQTRAAAEWTKKETDRHAAKYAELVHKVQERANANALGAALTNVATVLQQSIATTDATTAEVVAAHAKVIQSFRKELDALINENEDRESRIIRDVKTHLTTATENCIELRNECNDLANKEVRDRKGGFPERAARHKAAKDELYPEYKDAKQKMLNFRGILTSLGVTGVEEFDVSDMSAVHAADARAAATRAAAIMNLSPAPPRTH